MATDLYGILNYTSWIATILTRPVLDIYRAAIGAFEMGMLTSWVLFVRAPVRLGTPSKRDILLFVPAFLILPLNLVLIYYFQSSLGMIFDIIKTAWLVLLTFTLFRAERKSFKVVIFSMICWNLLWLAEVVLHEQLSFISEATSWMMFVIAEMILTIGLSYFLVQIIAVPKTLKIENRKNFLPSSLINAISYELHNAFTVEKIYTNIDLSASMVADRINIPVNELSAYLNKVVKKNFNQYLIDFRVNESILLLQEPSAINLTIEQIMLASGFASKSVFNTAFKKKTGLTPSQFRKSVKRL
ncbi:MAG: helix-turn-helix domain-containing protein [Verrucomicrobiota bacterium]